MLNDAEFGAHATSAPRLAPQQGKADIGGRMRVATILQKLGLHSSEPPERIAGATNEVWRAGEYVIRVGFVAGAERLRREAALSTVLPREVLHPKVIASGSEPFGEWMVLKHRQGTTLSEAWASMELVDRRSAVQDIAVALRSLHEMSLENDELDRLDFHEGLGALSVAHQLPAERVLSLIEPLRSRRHIDAGLVNAIEDKTKELANVISPDEKTGFIHGDLHFENVLVKDGIMVGLLDFEWSRMAPREIDVDVLARFCAHPDIHIGGSYHVNRADFKDVLRWLCKAYPELFSHELFKERLMLCALSFEVPSLLAMPPPSTPTSKLSPHHPINRIRDLLDFGTHAERLGWD